MTAPRLNGAFGTSAANAARAHGFAMAALAGLCQMYRVPSRCPPFLQHLRWAQSSVDITFGNPLGGLSGLRVEIDRARPPRNLPTAWCAS
jgi:hypothetical protein